MTATDQTEKQQVDAGRAAAVKDRQRHRQRLARRIRGNAGYPAL